MVVGEGALRSTLSAGIATVAAMDRRRLWLSIAGLILLTVIAHGISLRNGFVWDDDDHFTANPAMTQPGGLTKIWTSLSVSRYYPLTLTTFWLERHLWGLNPVPYHAVNILLHALNAILVWLILRQLKLFAPWTVAALWAVHPVTVESVAWITELKNTQSGVFFFLSLLLYLRIAEAPSRAGSLAALACGLAAMLSKPSTVVLPAVVILCDWWRQGRWSAASWRRVAPLLVFGLAMSVLAIVEQRHTIDAKGTSDWDLSFFQRVTLAAQAVWFYAGKVFRPDQLSFIYPRWDLRAATPAHWLAVGGIVWMAGWLWWFRQRDWTRGLFFGLACFCIALLPVLGFFDIYYFRFSYVADHFQYLASAALIALAVGGSVRVFPRAIHGLGPPVAGLLILVLGIGTGRQSLVYRDAETLWRDTLEKNPGAWLAHGELGVILGQEGHLDEAVDHYQRALVIKPDYAEAQYNLGLALLFSGKTEEGITAFQRAVEIYPGYADAHCNLGAALARAGRFPEAIVHYQAALRIKPDFAEAHYNLGNTLTRVHREPEAIQEWQAAVRWKPDFIAAYNQLGIAYAKGGKTVEAIREFEQALAMSPDSAETHQNLGRLLAALGRTNEAAAHLDRVGNGPVP